MIHQTVITSIGFAFNNPSLLSATVVSAVVILFWAIAIWASMRALRRELPNPLKLILIGLVALLLLVSPVVLYVLVTTFILIDFK